MTDTDRRGLPTDRRDAILTWLLARALKEWFYWRSHV